MLPKSPSTGNEGRRDDLRRLLLCLVAVDGEDSCAEVDEEVGVTLLAEDEVALVVVPEEARKHGRREADGRGVYSPLVSLAYC